MPVANAEDRCWHFSAVPTAPINVRNRGENGLNADMPPRPNLTQVGHQAEGQAHRAGYPQLGVDVVPLCGRLNVQ